MVQSMADDTLQGIFAQLVGQRAGQQRRRGVDDRADSLTNLFGRNIDIRSWWTPDEAFFGLMATEDLRRLATYFLPGNSATRFASARKKDLVRTLADNFSRASDKMLGDSEIERRMNDWIPGIMSFPARIDMKSNTTSPDAGAEMIDLEAVLFDA